MTIKFFSLISNEIMYRNPKTFDYILFILYFSLLHYVREYKVGTAPLKWGGVGWAVKLRGQYLDMKWSPT